MLGPSVIMASVPFSVGYSSYSLRQAPDKSPATAAFFISVIEGVLLLGLLLLLFA